MVETVVRCPYCVLGDNFMEMVAHIDGRMICRKSGMWSRPRMHTSVQLSEVPGDEDLRKHRTA
jgi:hypothetical protein